MTTSIETRIMHAENALAAHLECTGDPQDGDASIIDLVTNLLHLARSKGYDCEAITRMAHFHVDAEEMEEADEAADIAA